MAEIKESEARKLRIKDLILEHLGYYPDGKTILCPFHADGRKSAKIFEDNDGDRIYCFTERRQFSTVDFLRHVGVVVLPDKVHENKFEGAVDLSSLAGFEFGDLSMDQFCDLLLDIIK